MPMCRDLQTKSLLLNKNTGLNQDTLTRESLLKTTQSQLGTIEFFPTEVTGFPAHTIPKYLSPSGPHSKLPPPKDSAYLRYLNMRKM